MKKILFFLSIAFFACNSTVETDNTHKKITNTPKAVPVASKNIAANTFVYPERNLEKPDIKIKVEGIKSGEVSLIGILADQNYKAATAQVGADGSFTFKGDKPFEAGLYFVLLPNESNFQVIIDEDQTFSLNTNTRDLVGAMKVEGSKENQLLYENLLFERDYQRQFQKLTSEMNSAGEGTPAYEAKKAERQEIIDARTATLEKIFDANPNAFFTSFKRAGQNPNPRDIRLPNGEKDNEAITWHYRRDFWKGVDFEDERLLRTPVISNKLKRYITELTPQNKDSIITSATYLVDKSLPYGEYFKYFANWITLNYDAQKTTLMDPQGVYVHMVQNYFTNERAFWSDSVQVYSLQQRAYEMQNSVTGKIAKNVTAAGPDGKMNSLYDLKSDFVVVYMFNPDCEHCQEETPKLVQFYKEWKSKGIEVFGIAIDTETDEWKNYITKVGADAWTNVFDPTNRAIYPNWFVDITPEIYVLDKDKRIIAKNLKVNQIETIINRYR